MPPTVSFDIESIKYHYYGLLIPPISSFLCLVDEHPKCNTFPSIKRNFQAFRETCRTLQPLRATNRQVDQGMELKSLIVRCLVCTL